jgi:protein TonB
VPRNLLAIVARIARITVALCVVLLALLPASTSSFAQKKNAERGQSFEEVARKFAATLHKSHVKRIAILDFEDPNKEVTPVGAWLADQFAAAPGSPWPPIQVVDRKQIAAKWEQLKTAESNTTEPERIVELAKSFQAIAVKGSYGAAENGLGLTLTTWYSGWGHSDSLAAKLAITDEMKSHLTQPLESLVPKDGIFTAGAGGVSLPRCVVCPQPNFSAKELNRRPQGAVLLMVVVDVNGRASKIEVKKGMNPELDQDAVDAVKHWTFKPAADVDGKAVAVHMPIQIALH